MTFKDMIAMSVGNLWRRKLRTCLTVLGVLIGTVSIVAMLSVALGMKQMMLAEFNTYGSATGITVNSGVSEDTKNNSKDYILSDENIEKMKEIEHVESVIPALNLDILMETGKYSGSATLTAVPKEELEQVELGEGKHPNTGNQSQIETIMGNCILTWFYDSKTGETSYYETGELPDIDIYSKSLKCFVLNENAREEESETQRDEESATEENTQDSFIVPFDLQMTGMTKGEPGVYTSSYSFSLLADIDNVKAYLLKNFKKGYIPGQPKDEHGKAYKDWIYSTVTVKVDHTDNVEAVTKELQDMGFQASSDQEGLKEINQVMLIVELVLGSIGMIAFLVAAIGIANTMMMSTYERTKEIGIMKVLGCDMKNIMGLFLAEAGFIGFLGGVIGVLLTKLLSIIANSVFANVAASSMEFAAEDMSISLVPIWLILAAIAFATLMGMLAGFFPARRAMNLSPLAAIRNE